MQQKPASIKSTASSPQPTWPALARFIQVNLGLDDLDSINASALMDRLKALGANGVVFNTGGIYAWYPSKVLGHTVHPSLGDRDAVAEAAKAAHDAGLAMIGRFDFSLIEEALAIENQDWVARTDNGAMLEIGGPRSDDRPPLIATAMTGAYRREVALEILAEAHQRTPLDAVFFNAPEPFADALDSAPRPGDYQVASAAFFENWEAWRTAVTSVNPGCLILGRFNAFQYRDLDELAATSDLLTSQPLDWLDGGFETRRPSWFAALTTKVGRRAMNDRPPVIIVHAAPGLSWRHVALPSAEARMWLAQVLANGGGLWHTLTGLPDHQHDKRLLSDIAWANARAQAAEPWLTNTQAVADIGLVIPRREHVGSDHSEAAGLIDALTAGRRFFHPLSEPDLTDETLKDLETLILPSVECLSADEADAIKRFAEAGGTVIATYRTGWRDETGAVRPSPALADLFGFAAAGEPTDDLYASYIGLQPETPLSAHFQGTDMLAGQGPFQTVTADRSASIWAKMVPPFAVRGGVGKPPERVRLLEASDHPAIIAKGKVIYVAHALGTLITRFALPDHRNLLLCLLDIAANPERVRVDAPVGVLASIFQKGETLILHLVNAVGERPLSEVVPIHGIELHVQAQAVRSVPNGIELSRNYDGSFAVGKLGVWLTLEIEI